MVDVGDKAVTARRAVATGRVDMQPETIELIRTNRISKGDPLGVAQVAGIMGAKRTHELVPMCHPLLLTAVDLRVRVGRPLASRSGARSRRAAKPASRWRR